MILIRGNVFGITGIILSCLLIIIQVMRIFREQGKNKGSHPEREPGVTHNFIVCWKVFYLIRTWRALRILQGRVRDTFQEAITQGDQAEP